MRIAVNTRTLLPDSLEGIGYFTQEICRRLPDLLPEAEFLFCFDRPFDPVLTAHPRVSGKVVWPPTRDPLLWDIWFEYRIPRILRQWGADVFFSPDGHGLLRTTVPQLLVTHDIAYAHYTDHLPKRVQRYYERRVPRFLRAAYEVVTVSDFVSQDIHRCYGTPLAKLTVASNGVKPDFQPLSAHAIEEVRQQYSGGEPYLFYLGAVHPRKNIARLIAAYDIFRRADNDRAIPLLIGGRLAWKNEAIREAYHGSEFRADIHFLGYLSESELPRVIGGALAMIYPSLSEGFGVPLLEAMHVEVAIATSRSSSLPEVGGAAALYFDPEDTEDMARALRRITTDASLRAKLVAAGRLQRQRYTWDRAAEVIAAALRRGKNA